MSKNKNLKVGKNRQKCFIKINSLTWNLGSANKEQVTNYSLTYSETLYKHDIIYFENLISKLNLNMQ